jgi:hypothetical protein
MTLLERWSLHLSALAMALSGLAYGWLKYFGQRMGEFGLEAHPLQGLAEHAHVLLGPLLVFSLGLAVRAHVTPMLRKPRKGGARTGLALTLVLGPMVLSGYAVQVAVDPRWRLALAWVHGPLALLFLLGYGLHLFLPGKRRRGLAGCAESA